MNVVLCVIHRKLKKNEEGKVENLYIFEYENRYEFRDNKKKQNSKRRKKNSKIHM